MSSGSKWGNPRDNQIEATVYGPYNETITIPEVRFLGFAIRKERHEEVAKYQDRSTVQGDEIPDDISASRKFKFRCGLIKAINSFSGDHSGMTLYLDGFPNVFLGIGNIEFQFDPELTEEPIAEIIFSGHGTRKGKFERGRKDEYAFLIFKDRDQMRQFVIATHSGSNPGQVHQSGSLGSDCGRNRGDDMWPLAAVAGLAIGMAAD